MVGVPRTHTIVVGYDGSGAARAAAEYAARRAGPQTKLVLVHAYAAPEQEAHGRELLDEVLPVLTTGIAGLDLETETIAGRPAEAIVETARARDAGEIVVGSRGFGGTRMSVGSVSHELLHIADRPVVVVPGAGHEERRPVHPPQAGAHRRSPRQGSPS